MINILCIVQSILSSTEISIIRPFNFLAENKKIIWRLTCEKDFQSEMLDEVNLVVFQRNCHPNSLKILEQVQQKNLPIIYELDDNFLEIPEDLPIGKYLKLPPVVRTWQTFVKSATLVKVGSPEMIPQISQLNSKIVHHPYAIDFSIIDQIESTPTEQLVIGYAGTIYHHQDFSFVSPAIHQIAQMFPEIKWEFIGCMPETLKDLNNLTFIEFINNYETFLQLLKKQRWQIALAPLTDNPSNRSKTDNKFREYSACGITGIYSNIPPYSSVILPGKTGILADNQENSWYDALQLLISDPQLRQKIANQSLEWVRQHRSLEIASNLWEEILVTVSKLKGAT